MFTTVRYFVKTSIIFLITGISTGLFMSFSKYFMKQGYGYELVSAHTHLILIGSVMMMIMGVAIWFFPRAAKDDKKYNPDLILVTYIIMTAATALRFTAQVILSFTIIEWLEILVFMASMLQTLAIILFFYTIWGRIRAVGSQIREARGEKF
ncbi:MAG: hypothetical protein K9I71_11555 [Ignavibacteriales bacterium]|nr:hypothetical protein [Ignavibacteriales bacterium]MCF8316757.1 hypothetical protein [Ignavibacteriales bacterium]MCF8438061.1 hypothetical protein [Ignavibacteriales bacterium]